jgi:hypothetical protein
LNENASKYYAPIIGYAKYSKKERNDNCCFCTKGKWQLSSLNKIKEMKKYAPVISLTLSS